jgi:hypothetical protein
LYDLVEYNCNKPWAKEIEEKVNKNYYLGTSTRPAMLPKCVRRSNKSAGRVERKSDRKWCKF